MRQMNILILMAVLVSQVYAAPQFITFKDGKLGVNFGGYHAGVGMTGLLGGGGAGGGLFAEAGTPHGQSARAGLGGSVDEKGGASGGLFAGATAGGNVKAATGLGGAVGQDKTSGSGFASAQAGSNYATSSMGGETSEAGSNGFIISSKTKVPSPVENESEVSVLPIEIIKPEITNELRPTADAAATVDIVEKAKPVGLEQVVIVEPKPKFVEKYYKKHNKPHRHHLRKTYVTEYVEPATVVKSVQPIEKKIDIIAEGPIDAPVDGVIDQNNQSTDQVTYTKEVTVGRNPSFFQDIFNIPISTLKAVSDLLGGVAKDTSISLEKSASVEGETDAISHKYNTASGHQSSDAHISVQTPSASKIIDGIFAIPINTLGAVNKFLENNVSGRKRIQVTQESSEPTKVRLGPHARRRANKHVVVVEQEEKHEE